MANDPMADPHTGADAPPERRQRRSERKRRRIRRVVAGVATVAVAVVFVLLATDMVRFSGDEQPSLAGTVHAGGVEDGPATVTTTVDGKRCRTLSTTDPLRLWVGGDSLAGSLGPALGTITGATGVVQPYFDSRVSSGLADPGFFDWPDHATTEMARLDPEVVVFIIGTNDWTAVSGDAWKAEYTDKVDSDDEDADRSRARRLLDRRADAEGPGHGRGGRRGQRDRAGRRQAPPRGAVRRRPQAVRRERRHLLLRPARRDRQGRHHARR